MWLASSSPFLWTSYDTRGYRFYKDFPGVKFFEVDLPAMSADKQKRMSDNLPDMPNNVTYAPIDFDTQELGQVLATVAIKRIRKPSSPGKAWSCIWTRLRLKAP